MPEENNIITLNDFKIRYTHSKLKRAGISKSTQKKVSKARTADVILKKRTENLEASKNLFNKAKKSLLAEGLSNAEVEVQLRKNGMYDLVNHAQKLVDEIEKKYNQKLVSTIVKVDSEDANIITKRKICERATITNEMICELLKQNDGNNWKVCICSKGRHNSFRFVCKQTKEELLVCNNLMDGFKRPRTEGNEILAKERANNANWMQLYFDSSRIGNELCFYDAKISQFFAIPKPIENALQSLFGKLTINPKDPELSIQNIHDTINQMNPSKIKSTNKGGK